jgi:hypothetical protein
LTQESNLSTLLAYGALVAADEAFDFLLSGEFADERKIFLLEDAAHEIKNMPRSPSDEDPHVSSQEQVMTLFRVFTLKLSPMRNRYDYQQCDKIKGIWKWKTRTVRLAGMYYGNSTRFVIAQTTFARDLKRNGKANTSEERKFAAAAAARLNSLGLLEHAWITGDPHLGETDSFDPD